MQDLKLFSELDSALSDLAKSDSSIEYAIHIRDEFNKVIEKLNTIKRYNNINEIDSDGYFE